MGLFQKIGIGNCLGFLVTHTKIWFEVKAVQAPQYAKPAVTSNSILKGIVEIVIIFSEDNEIILQKLSLIICQK